MIGKDRYILPGVIRSSTYNEERLLCNVLVERGLKGEENIGDGGRNENITVHIAIKGTRYGEGFKGLDEGTNVRHVIHIRLKMTTAQQFTITFITDVLIKGFIREQNGLNRITKRL